MGTLDDLQAAFAGESQANRKYLAFAKAAEADGKPKIAQLFRAAAEAETVHAHAHLKAMKGVGTTAENVKEAIEGENHEFSVMYPEFMRYTFAANPGKFATIGRLLDPRLETEPEEVAAEESCRAMDEFLRKIGMYFTLEELKVPRQELPAIADDSVKLPDYTVNPKVATRDEILDMLNNRI